MPTTPRWSWYAIRTLEGCEQSVFRRMTRSPMLCQAVMPFLPRESVAGPGGVEKQVPIFEDYLFLAFPGATCWPTIRRLPGVIGPLATAPDAEPYLFPERDIARLYEIQALLRHVYEQERADAAARERPQRQRRRRVRASKRARARDDARALQGSFDGMAISVVGAEQPVRAAA